MRCARKKRAGRLRARNAAGGAQQTAPDACQLVHIDARAISS